MSTLRKILVVDDDPVVGKSITRVLTNKGYAVITAENAEEAMGKLHAAKYDAVFTDIRMPGMDGVELAEHVKAETPWMPVVIITGYGTAGNEARAKEAGVTAFLRKPLSPEMIEETAATAMAAAPVVAEAAPATAPVATPEIAAPAAPAAAPAAEEGGFKKAALLLGAPFIGLAYIVFLPFVGLGFLAVAAAKGLAKLPMFRTPLTFLKNVGLFVAAPFIGLLYVITFPFVAATLLVWTAVKGKQTEPTTKG